MRHPQPAASHLLRRSHPLLLLVRSAAHLCRHSAWAPTAAWGPQRLLPLHPAASRAPAHISAAAAPGCGRRRQHGWAADPPKAPRPTWPAFAPAALTSCIFCASGPGTLDMATVPGCGRRRLHGWAANLPENRLHCWSAGAPKGSASRVVSAWALRLQQQCQNVGAAVCVTRARIRQKRHGRPGEPLHLQRHCKTS